MHVSGDETIAEVLHCKAEKIPGDSLYDVHNEFRTIKETICMETGKENLNMNRHMDIEIGNHSATLHRAPHHLLPLMKEMDILLSPHVRDSLVSILYDIEVMKNVYGENYAFRMDQFAPETPEMKILFALIMGFKINVNSNLVEALLYQRSMGLESSLIILQDLSWKIFLRNLA